MMKVMIAPIKCQGIKSKLVPFIKRVVDWSFEGRWVEPFMGSGVVGFNIEPWWKQLKSLALRGKRFETREELTDTLESAVCWWNKHKYPYQWKKVPQQQPRYKLGAYGTSMENIN